MGAIQYFYRYLKGKVFIAIALNILIGLLDGFGLSMFLPLLQMAGGEPGSTGTSGEETYVTLFFESIGLTLTIQIAISLIIAFFVLKGIIYYLKAAFQVKFQQSFIRDVRLENIQSLGNLQYQYFLKSDAGRIQNTLTGEVDRVARACQSYFVASQHIILVLVYVVFAFALDWRFALIVCAGAALSNQLYRRIYQRTRGTSRKLTVDSSHFQNLIFQAISNYKYLRATGEIRKYEDKLKTQVEFIENNNKRIGMLNATLSACREPLSIIVVCIAILVQTSLFSSNLSSVLISLLFFYRALNSLMQFQSSWNSFLSHSGSLENIRLFNEELQKYQQTSGSIVFSHFNSKIELEDVGLSFDLKPVLRNVNLEIYRNETLALVGESGSGKSSLVNLLSGLISVREGTIKIDGVNYSSLNLGSLQERIGFITQEPVIFSDTIFNNVTLWAGSSEENILRFREACRKASILDFVEKAGWDTLLGTNGLNLSGGQRQRIAIARELYKEIDILILDEATSALDAETENEIQKSIESLKGELTLIIIAHRLSAIRPADRIVFLKNGYIAQVDDFQNLYDNNLDFRNLVELQEVAVSAKACVNERN